MEEIAVPHDAAYKSIFSHPEMVESLLREFIPAKYLEGIQFETLAPLKSDFVSDKLQQRFADSVWKVKCGGVTHFILIHLEFQSTVDPWMAVRMANYCTSLWLELTKLASTHESLTPEGMLPPILPIVLYIGAQKWTAKTSTKELLPLERGHLLAYQPLQSYILFDVGRMDDGELASREGLAALILRAQKSGEATDLMAVVNEFITRLTKPEHAPLLRSLLNWFKHLLRRAGFGDRVEAIDSLTEVNSMLAERIVHWKDEFVRGEIARGKAEGISIGEARGKAEGISIGEARGKAEAVRQLLNDFLTARYGTIPRDVTERISTISDADRLQRITQRAYRAESLQALTELLLKDDSIPVA